MLNAFYKELVECVNPLGIDEVHYNFVEKQIDTKSAKTYITYFRASKKPDYEIGICVSTIQVSVFNQKLETAVKVRDEVSRHFSDMVKIIDDTEICGVSIISELEKYDNEDNLHQAITTIKFLTK